MNLWPLIITLVIVAAAELGDQTQLLALGFAARYPLWEVLMGVFSATAILMALAVVFGEIIYRYIPTFYLQLFAGLLFLFFGFWSLRGEKEEEGTAVGKNPFWVVFAGFFLAELGDKTQLATFALTAKYGAPFQVWLGATLGMLMVNGLGIAAGGWIQKLLPGMWLKWIGAGVFIIFGLVTLGDIFLW